MPIKDGFWFYLEPYVFFEIKKEEVIIVNMLDSSIIVNNDKRIIDIVSSLIKHKNAGVCYISKADSQSQNISGFISKIRSLYMGDLIPVNLAPNKPMQFLPQIDFCKDDDCKKLARIYSSKSLNTLLKEVSIYVSGQCSTFCGYCSSYYKQFSCCTKEIHGIMAVPELGQVLSKLSKSGIRKINLLCIQALSKEYYKDFFKMLGTFKGIPLNIILNYKSLCPDNEFLLRESRLKITLIIDDSSINGELEKDFHLFSENTNFLFPLSSENYYDDIMNFVNKHNITDYKIIPALNGHNKKIITKLIYIRKKEITHSIEKKTIELNKLLNCNFWGKFIILPNGDVLSDFYSKVRGNIFKDSIIDLIDKEISLKDSFWLRTRNNTICNKCVFQHLCPPPSNYELFLNKPAICFKYI